MAHPRFMVWLILAFFTLFGFSCAGENDKADDDDHGPPADDDASDDDSGVEIGHLEKRLSDWRLRSSDGLAEDGAAISEVNFDTSDWYAVTVPATVLAGLVAAGVYPDPMYGMNLHNLPGTWPIGMDVSIFPMPNDSPFLKSWWYRTEFQVPTHAPDEAVWLRFEGINFRANIWLNGQLIADAQQVAGTYREYEFNVTDVVCPGQTNVLAVEIIASTPHDLAWNWVDWNPAPPDRNMGIFRDVKLLTTGPVALRNPHVIPRLEMPEMKQASLTISAELVGAAAQPVTGILRGRIEDLEFSQEVTLAAGEHKRVYFQPANYPQLVIQNPRVWWPAHLGEQNLYKLDLQFEAGSTIADRQSLNFGIRDVQAPLTDEGYRYFVVNGRKILIRGAAWSPDLLLREWPERMEAEIRYAADIGLNMLRLEGKMEIDAFYDLCDKYGIMLMPGWCCCDHWQFCDSWNDEDYVVASESLRTQLYHLRNHPSVVVWLNGSDDPPSPPVERMYIGILEDQNWSVPYLSSADDQNSEVTGPSGVKMVGPYDYVPPEYWLTDTRFGGAFGFNTETCPGEVIPPVENLLKFIPEDHLWPIDMFWLYHAGRGYYLTLHPFNRAMDRRYGGASGIDEYVLKAQVLDYDNHRAMFEAFGRNKYHATGVIQFLMNNAWPSLIWHLYDYYLYPGGAYFGAKKALELLHIQYSYDDRSVDIVNSSYESYHGLQARATILNFDLTEKFRQDEIVDVEPDGVVHVLALPEIADLTTTYFLKLELATAQGEFLSRNFYWLSTQPVILLWNLTIDERKTPLLQDADLTLLNSLPAVTLNAELSAETGDEPGWEQWKVHMENADSSIAFFVQLRLLQGVGGEDVLPVLWEDNDFPLLPGESRDVGVRFRTADLQALQPAVEISGWNVAPEVIE